MYKKMFCLITSALIIALTSISASANSSQMYWSGQSGSSTIIKDEKSPLIVESELLTFDLQEFPKNYYSSTEEFENYSGKVTAKYTIKNPTDKDVTARLAFPFGTMPAYDFSEEFNFQEIPKMYDDKYKISVNGKEIDKTLRHTFSYGFGAFDYKNDTQNLCDEYKKDDFYSPDTPVKVYVFEANGIPEEFIGNAFASASFSLDADKTRVLLADCSSYNYENYKTARAGLLVENGISFTMYVIGKDIDTLPKWTVYEDSLEEKECSGEVKLLFTDNRIFEDIALMFHSPDSGVSETDWYNAAIDKLNNLAFYSGFLGSDNELMLSDCLMQWFEYEITVNAGETITNSVSAPIYPDINHSFSPTVYDYTYLLSPANSWSKFGKIDVVIYTPYYISDSTVGQYTKVKGGYTLTVDSIPEDELFFTLSTSQNPKEENIYYFDILHQILAVLLILSVLANVALIVVIILKSKRKNK